MKLGATRAWALLVLTGIAEVSPAVASTLTFLRTERARSSALHNDDDGKFLPFFYASDRHTLATVTQVATCPPKTGQTTNIIADNSLYKSLCEKGGLMDMFNAGEKGVIGDVDLSGDGSVFLKGSGTEAWAPIRALQGLENCVLKGGTVAPVPATTPAPVAATTAQFTPPTPVTKAPDDDDAYPTTFLLSGCRRMKVEEPEEKFIDPSGMTHSKCFARCREHKGARQFAILNGGVCFCSMASLGEQLSTDSCDTRCGGDQNEFCGAVTAASVFTMIDCSFTVDEEKEEVATKTSKLLNSYARFEEKSCGQDKDNLVEVGGSSSMAGTVDQCKLACWQAKGAQQCQGFTYDDKLSQCTFHIDVFAGTLAEGAGMTCFWKKI